MKTHFQGNARRAIWAGGALLLFLLILMNAPAIKETFLENLRLCIHTLVPSVFPMLVLSAFLTEIGFPRPLMLLWHNTVGRLSAFSENSSQASFFGLTSGYPVGVKTAAVLYRSKKISKAEAQRLALSCVHPGIPFSVLAAGRAMFRSQTIGWLFFISVLLADLLIAKATYLQKKASLPIAPPNEKTERRSAQDALIRAVDSGIRNMSEILAWVLLFGVFYTAVTARLSPVKRVLLPVAEVTAAVHASAKTHAPVAAAFSLGFGGICIHLQLLKELNVIGVRPLRFLCARLAAGALSAAFTYAGVLLFPQIVPTVSRNTASIRMFQTDFAGFLSLCAVAVLFILEIYERNPSKHRNPAN